MHEHLAETYHKLVGELKFLSCSEHEKSSHVQIKEQIASLFRSNLIIRERFRSHPAIQEEIANTRTPVFRSDARNNNIAKNATSSQAKYQQQVYLAVGAQVMVRSNLWTSAGVVNGSIGVIRDIVVHPDKANESGSREVVVLVQLPGYTGPAPLHDHPNWGPIRMCDSDWVAGKRNTNCKRTQVPLDLAWALTIHIHELFLTIHRGKSHDNMARASLGMVATPQPERLRPWG